MDSGRDGVQQRDYDDLHPDQRQRIFRYPSRESISTVEHSHQSGNKNKMNHLASNWMRNLLLGIITAIVGVFCAFALNKVDKIYAFTMRQEVMMNSYEKQHDEMLMAATVERERVDKELADKATHQEVDLKITAAARNTK
jgi:hypothetical protein